MNYKPKDTDFETRVRMSFSRQPFMVSLKAEMKRIEPGICEIHVPYSEAITQQHGYFHAGIVSTVADNAAGYAAFSLMASDSSVLTVEFKLNLLAPADGDILIGCSEVLKYGRTLTVCRSEAFVMKAGIKKLCAASLSTLIELKKTSDSKPSL